MIDIDKLRELISRWVPGQNVDDDYIVEQLLRFVAGCQDSALPESLAKN